MTEPSASAWAAQLFAFILSRHAQLPSFSLGLLLVGVLISGLTASMVERGLVARVSAGGATGGMRRDRSVLRKEIPDNSNDDPEFAELASRLISVLVDNSLPAEIFLIKIDNWFDHKWLKFSGRGRVGFGLYGDLLIDLDTALDEFRQDKITFPPFTPNRVIEQYYFLRDEKGDYSSPGSAPLVHRKKMARSSANLHKRVTDFAESAVFVWLSSNTKLNRRGSVMVYEVQGSSVRTWYAALSKEEDWKVSQTKGIALEQVQSWMTQNVGVKDGVRPWLPVLSDGQRP